MDNINFEENLSQIKMDKSKAAAQALNESWNTKLSFNSAGSYVDGVKKEISEVSNSDYKISKPGFSVGVLETALALNNTSFVELSEAKMLVDRYVNHATVKGISEAFLIEHMIKDLEAFSWEKNAKSALDNLKKVYESRVKEIEVAKAIEEINRTAGKEIFSTIVESMKNWIGSEEKIADKLISDLKKWAFNPSVRTLIEKLTALEGKNDKRFSISVNSGNCEVKSLIAPALVYESSTVFMASDRFFKAESGKISILERKEASQLPKEFLKAALLLSQPSIKINENGLDLYINQKKVSVLIESESGLKTVKVDGVKIPNDKLGFMLSMQLRNSINYAPQIVDDVISVIESADYLTDIDFGKKIVSKVYEGVEANVFKYSNKAYVQRVNPAMRKNELFEGNGNQVVNNVKEFLGFDISESMVELLNTEDKVLVILKNDKEAVKANLQIVESEITKLKKAIELNPNLQNSDEIKEAQSILEAESGKLKSKWNQVNVEIERFEKGHKKVSKITENEGYGVNTEIKVKRSGERGKVMGVNNNSKTYTVVFENGRTGEFFFSDVIDLNDELSNSNLTAANEKQNQNFAKAPDRKGKKSGKFINDQSIFNLATAPSKTTKGSAKDIQDLKNMNLASIKSSGKRPKETKGVSGDMNLGKLKATGRKPKETKGVGEDMNLGKLPKTSNSGGPKFIQNLDNMNLAESQINKPLAKAPVGKKTAKPKKFVEDLKDSKLAKAKGDSRKNGKKFHEPLDRANLAKAPVSKKK
jgi:hypothetical protein